MATYFDEKKLSQQVMWCLIFEPHIAFACVNTQPEPTKIGIVYIRNIIISILGTNANLTMAEKAKAR